MTITVRPDIQQLPLSAVHIHGQFGTKYQTLSTVLADCAEYSGNTRMMQGQYLALNYCKDVYMNVPADSGRIFAAVYK